MKTFFVAICFLVAQSTHASCFAFGTDVPENQGVNVQQLIGLTEWVQANPQIPILSILISKNGQVVYQLLTSSLTGQEAHYLMSATKSVTSSLVGIAIDRGSLSGPDQKISTVLPASLFPSGAVQDLTLKNILGMSALYAPVAPHQNTPEAQQRLTAWFNSSNRVRFALTQPLVTHPGSDFFYTDITPSLAAGAVEYSTGQSLLDFADQSLFAPMSFANQEWMHEDPSGIDNGAYGLRLRPVDMQKFGNLFLNEGCWNGSQLISRAWVNRSFTAWIGSGENTYSPDYGWYWWKDIWAADWTSHGAIGWKGQRIEVFPQQNMVVTMTAIINDGSENSVFAKIVHGFIMHLSDPLPAGSNLVALSNQLKAELSAVWLAPTRIAPNTEPRMIPTVVTKETHIPFSPK